jgi:MFS family permease
MIYAVAVLVGIVSAVVGWFVTGVIAVWIAGLYGMSDFEGQRGMFAFLGVGPIGGLLAMVLSAWLVLYLGRDRAPVGATLVRVAIVLVAIAAVVGAVIGIRLMTLDTYTNSLPPTLEFEVRVPATMATPPRSDVEVELHTDKNVDPGVLVDDWVEDANGSRVIHGSLSLSFKTSGRLLVVTLPNQPTRLFRLRLSRDPASTDTPSAWQRPDHIDPRDGAQPRAAPADDPVELRYRIRRTDGE